MILWVQSKIWKSGKIQHTNGHTPYIIQHKNSISLRKIMYYLIPPFICHISVLPISYQRWIPMLLLTPRHKKHGKNVYSILGKRTHKKEKKPQGTNKHSTLNRNTSRNRPQDPGCPALRTWVVVSLHFLTKANPP